MRTKSTQKNTINVITLGCSKNVYDSEVLMGQLRASDKKVVHQEEGNIVVINTCGFIDNAKEESVNTILEQVKNKEAGKVDKVYVTGCLGFIGYHVTRACLEQGWYVRGVDKGTYAANWNLLKELESYKTVKVYNLSSYFDEDFFRTKKIVYLPLKYKG